jgi:L-amino acid N-acyltransferase YncA
MIRLACPSDAPAIADIYAPWVRDTPITFETTPPDAAEMAARIAHVLPALPFLVWDSGAGQIEGYAYASAHNPRLAYQWSLNFSVYLRANVLAKGLGRALYTSLIALTTRQGYCMAVGGITLPNPASVRLHESLGFVLVGVYKKIGFKLGAWHDVGWWQRPLNNPPPDSAPTLRSITDLQNSGDLGLAPFSCSSGEGPG